MFSDLYELGKELKVISNDDQIIAVGATNGEKSALMFTYYTDDDKLDEFKRVMVSFDAPGKVGVKILDKTRNA